MKEEIKRVVAKFIEKRLFATRDIQKMESKPEDIIMIDDFCALLNQYTNSIIDLDNKKSKTGYTKLITKDIKKIPVLQAIQEGYINLEMHKDSIAQIDDMTREIMVSILDAKIRSMFEKESKYFEILKYINLKTSIENKKDISAEDFNLLLELLKFYENIVKNYQEEIGEEVFLNIESEGIELLEMMKALKNALVRDKLQLAQFSDDNIKEITALIKRYFDLSYDTLKDKKEDYSINYFMRDVLQYIIENDKEKEYIDLANKYINYFYCNDHAGINNIVDGKVKFGYSNFISLRNNDYNSFFSFDEDYNTFFRVDEDMKIKKAYNEEDDYFLFGKDITFWLVRYKGEEHTIPVRKVIIDGEVKYHNFFEKRLKIPKYFVEINRNIIKRDDEIILQNSLKTRLAWEGFVEYYQNIYSSKDFKKIINLLANSQELTEEDMDKIDEVSLLAADWWVKRIVNSSHNAAFSGDINIRSSLSDGNGTREESIYYTDELIEKFKELLKLEIRKNLISRRTIYLSVNYGPDYELNKYAVDFGVNGTFSWKPNMKISVDEIKVSEGYGASYETIFKREENKKREL